VCSISNVSLAILWYGDHVNESSQGAIKNEKTDCKRL
jgi:hypothetical protein